MIGYCVTVGKRSRRGAWYGGSVTFGEGFMLGPVGDVGLLGRLPSAAQSLPQVDRLVSRVVGVGGILLGGGLLSRGLRVAKVRARV
jgi:hypothetical protein